MDPFSTKRFCPFGDPFAPSAASSSARVPSGGNTVPMDRALEAILSLSDLSVALDLALERLLESQLLEADKDRLVDHAMDAGIALLEAAKRSARRRASKHNSAIWPLSADLTIKVFSFLDTQSLCHASASCLMFNKCATDSLCYANIDLTADMPKVNNTVVSTMIQRAGRNLKSLKLGVRSSANSTEPSQTTCYSTRNSSDTSASSWSEKRARQGRESSGLTRSCLVALTADGGSIGTLLRGLHLYNIDKLDNSALCTALSACPFLIDLEVVGLHVELRRTLDAVSKNCHSMERLSFESSDTGRDDSLNSATCMDLVNGCPNLNSLALRGFKLHDHKVRILVKGFPRLSYVDFSTSYSITGAFLRNIGNGIGVHALEVLILRDCLHLKEVEMSQFLTALLAGDFKLLRHLDISNKDGLSADNDWNYRCYNPCTFLIDRMSAERPEISILAKFPPEGSFIDIDHTSDSEISSWTSLQIMADVAYFTNSLESSYSSDQNSANDDAHDMDSSDELE